MNTSPGPLRFDPVKGNFLWATLPVEEDPAWFPSFDIECNLLDIMDSTVVSLPEDSDAQHLLRRAYQLASAHPYSIAAAKAYAYVACHMADSARALRVTRRTLVQADALIRQHVAGRDVWRRINDPHYQDLVVQIAGLYVQRRQYTAAMRMVRRAIAIRPGSTAHIHAHRLLVDLHFSRSNYADAQRVLSKPVLQDSGLFALYLDEWFLKWRSGSELACVTALSRGLFCNPYVALVILNGGTIPSNAWPTERFGYLGHDACAHYAKRISHWHSERAALEWLTYTLNLRPLRGLVTSRISAHIVESNAGGRMTREQVQLEEAEWMALNDGWSHRLLHYLRANAPSGSISKH